MLVLSDLVVADRRVFLILIYRHLIFARFSAHSYQSEGVGVLCLHCLVPLSLLLISLLRCYYRRPCTLTSLTSRA